MKVLFLTGSHPRHASIARTLNDIGVLSGLVIEERKHHIPIAPQNIDENLKKLFNIHFHKRSIAEAKFFGENFLPNVEQIKINLNELNSEKVKSFIKKINPDILLSYGVHILSDEIINLCKGERWNIHGGLSPWYRGCITHFWPSYFLEPQMTGMTIHDLTQKLDAGDIVHQNSGELISKDGLHDLACRTVIGMQNELPILLNLFNNKGEFKKFKHKTTGKIWTAKNWRPEHLKLIYDCYDDKIVDAVINGEIKGRIPKLFRQF